MRPALLVLFDVEGTLLMEDAYAHGRAMTRAMREVWRVELPDDVVQRIEPWGKTDVRIARERREAREHVAVAGVGSAPAPERLALELAELADQLGLFAQPALVARDHLRARAVAADLKRVAHFEGRPM